MAAFVQTLAGSKSPNQHYSNDASSQLRPNRHGSKQRFMAELSHCLVEFVIQLLPTPQERIVKEDVRKLLERLIRNIEPQSRLLSFGSTANGFSLRNSDMDLCCLIDAETRPTASELVNMLGHHLERETKFHVKPLPHARIPIVKLSLDPSPGLPLGIACDIGFENRLALENTRLLMCYAMIDPNRVRTLVLFLKVWSKRRKINSPYKGTLSSYGYVLLVIFFLVHVKNPPVLPNLQQMPPLRPICPEDVQLCGYNTWFFDDIDLLRQRWQSSNTESVGELLVDFFRYYSRDFLYNTGVASIRAGLIKKDTKGWQHDLTPTKYSDPSRERNRLCIEDPFEIDYNVARCVTKDGLYTIRGEFMRAARILAARPEALIAIGQLCEERKEEGLISAPSAAPPRLLPLPPQTPYTIGSNSLRPKGVTSPERLSPQPQFFDPTRKLGLAQVADRLPPEHMAPKRGKWTSPPPPEASPADHTSFEDKLDLSLQMATSSTGARERDVSCASSSSNSEILSDDERHSEAAESDDVQSVRSYTEGSSPSISFRRTPRLRDPDSTTRIPPLASVPAAEAPIRLFNDTRGRLSDRMSEKTIVPPNSQRARPSKPPPTSSKRLDSVRRSSSGPPRTSNVPIASCPTPIALMTPLPLSPISPHSPYSDSNVFYATNGIKYPTVYPKVTLSRNSSQFSGILHAIDTAQDLASTSPASSYYSNYTAHWTQPAKDAERPSPGPHTPTPSSYSHAHSLSTTTIMAPSPSEHAPNFTPLMINTAQQKVRSRSPSPHNETSVDARPTPNRSRSRSPSPPRPSSTNESSSPTPSSSGYASSFSQSPSSSPMLPSSPRSKLAKVPHVPLPLIMTSAVVTLPVQDADAQRVSAGGE